MPTLVPSRDVGLNPCMIFVGNYWVRHIETRALENQEDWVELKFHAEWPDGKPSPFSGSLIVPAKNFLIWIKEDEEGRLVPSPELPD